MNAVACPSRERLSDYLLGRLPDGGLESISNHLETCPDCESRVVELEQLPDPLLEDLRQPAESLEEYVDEPQLAEVVQYAQKLSVAAASRVIGLSEGSCLGVYRIVGKLGRGGMGTVYSAIHVPLAKQVALKVLPADRVSNSRAVSRFRREMRALGRLEHPNLVGARDAGEVDGVPYLVMDLIQGLDVSAIASALGPLPIADACELVRQAAVGMEHARQQGIVHRDIKPSNLMLTPEGTVKVLDLGLARFVNSPNTEEISQQGVAMGTLEYMAPEQLSDRRPVDSTADVYSLGATLYRLLTGQTPYSDLRHASTVQKILAVTHSRLPSVREARPEIPAALETALEQMLEKAPAKRLPTPGAAAEALVPFVQGSDLVALYRRAEQSPPSAPDPTLTTVCVSTETDGASVEGEPQPRRPSRRKRLVYGSAAAVGLMCALIPLGGFLSGLGGAEPADGSRDASSPAGVVDAVSEKSNRLRVAAADDGEDAPSSENPRNDAGAERAAHPDANASLRNSPLAVLHFEDRGTDDASFGPRIAEIVFSSLATHDHLTLVDRNELKQTLDEQELNLSGLVRPDEAIRIGQLTGAKLLVTGAVSQLDDSIYIVAKIVGTETGRMRGVSVKGTVRDDLSKLSERLSEKVVDALNESAQTLIAKEAEPSNRLSKLKAALQGRELPTVWIRITERHIGAPAIDPAAEVELIHSCLQTGFPVIDSRQSRKLADIELVGEAFSEFAGRHGNLISVKARVEVKAVERETGRILAAESQTATAVDLAEQVAGKTALKQAAERIAERLLPTLAEKTVP